MGGPDFDIGRIDFVYQLLDERADFPKPVTQTTRGSLWDRRAIEAWKRRPRRTGRPRKAMG
jgi:predicted DNA-binding transcriptional regulator AlpA